MTAKPLAGFIKSTVKTTTTVSGLLKRVQTMGG